MTWRQVFEQFIDEGRISAERQAAMVATLQVAQSETTTPWFIRVFVGLSAWFAAILLLAFLFGMNIFGISFADGNPSALVVGLTFCVGAVGIRWLLWKGVFFEQLALAISLTGQALTFMGVIIWTSSGSNLTNAALALIALEVALIPAYPERLHRFISTVVLVGATMLLLGEQDLQEGVHLLVIGLAVGTLLIWERETWLATTKLEDFTRPIGYALPLTMFGLLCLSFIENDFITLWWISAAGLLLALLALEYVVLRDHGVDVRTLPALGLFAVTALLLVPAIQTPGIVAATMATLLGFRRSNWLLMGLAVGFLAVFLIGFYYNLEFSLLVKSYILLGTGVIFLGARWSLTRWLHREEVQA